MVRSRRGTLLPLVGLVLLVLLALFLGQAGRTIGAGRGTVLEAVAGICLVAAVVLLFVRIARRRRK
ncbi:MAG TPA: hypothetical protein VH458_07260 [Vicinamibacterales bacterium]